MDWFKDHAYLAPWLAPIVTIAAALIQKKGNLDAVNWHIVLLYGIFFSSLTVAFNSSFDTSARDYARMIGILAFVWLMMGTKMFGTRN